MNKRIDSLPGTQICWTHFQMKNISSSTCKWNQLEENFERKFQLIDKKWERDLIKFPYQKAVYIKVWGLTGRVCSCLRGITGVDRPLGYFLYMHTQYKSPREICLLRWAVYYNTDTTRMHSSRMRTGRSLTVCWSLLPGAVWGLFGRGYELPPGELHRLWYPG